MNTLFFLFSRKKFLQKCKVFEYYLVRGIKVELTDPDRVKGENKYWG